MTTLADPARHRARRKLADRLRDLRKSTHLAQLAEVPTATVGIVPFANPMPVMPLSGFVIRDDLVAIETLGGKIELADPAEVATYEKYFALLLDASVTGADASRLCLRVAAEM